MSYKRFISFFVHPPVFLFFLALLAYAPFFWERGFYWDELPWTWVYFQLGPEALTKLFSTSRPFWGMLYQVLLPLVGPNPLVWQVLVIPLRWGTAALVWLLLRQVWQRDERPALWTAALFLVYPGLGQNYISLMYTHFYIIFCAFLASLWLSLLAVRREQAWLHLPALLLGFVNLLTMEYFYFLEFFRAVLFFTILPAGPFWQKVRRVAALYWPYFLLIVGISVWRAFFFENQNASYGYQTLEDLRANFILGIGKLLLNMLIAFWVTVPANWLYPFQGMDQASLGRLTVIAASALALAGTLFAGLVLFIHRNRLPESEYQSWTKSAFWLGLAAWVLGGGAFWLVGERTLPQLTFSADRFLLSFMLGSSLMLAALIGWLGNKLRLQLVFLAVLVGFSVGEQFQTNATYRRDWDAQQAFFNQLAWRVPALQPGTTLLTNDLPVSVSSDNSLSGPLNWMYSPPGGMDAILYFASIRTQEGRALGAGLEPGRSFEQNYLATTFSGNTSRVLVIHYSPPGCLRVLDAEVDGVNRLIPAHMRDVLVLQNTSVVLPGLQANLPPYYALSAPGNWCWHFSRAELARQQGDWSQVVDLAEKAYALDDHPNDPAEHFVFIEGYAHAGNWELAFKKTRESYRVSREYLRPPLCALWNRIEQEIPGAPAYEIRAELGCGG